MDLEITKEDILKLIEIEKKDNIYNHLLNVLLVDFRPKGEIKHNEIKVWQQNSWNRITYPIFIFKLNSDNHLIDITDRINPIGKFFNCLILFALLYFFSLFDYSEINLADNWLVIFLTLIFFGVVFFVFYRYYQFEKKQQLKNIFKILDIEVEQEEFEREWSLKNILIRLFTYPFCLFLIGVTYLHIIPSGKYIMALTCFIIVGFYMISDIKLILKEKLNKK